MRTPPDQLKSLTPFVQRANELRTANAAMAYWCSYYAAQQGITAKISDKEANQFLMDLMDDLEDQKKALLGNDAVTDDLAGSAYVENFALKVFVGADNEDRSGKANKATAKKFLAASNFLELLKVFGELSQDTSEKIKYSKWKAADIAKAFREGRQPVPGPAGGLESEDQASNSTKDLSTPELSLPSTKEEDVYVAREMAKLMGETSTPSNVTSNNSSRLSPNSARPSTPTNEISNGLPTAVSPSRFEEDSNDFQALSSARAKARLSVDGRSITNSPNFSKPMRSNSSTSINSQLGNNNVIDGNGNIFNPPPLPPPTDVSSEAWNLVGKSGEELEEGKRRSIDASSSDMWLDSSNRRNTNFNTNMNPPNSFSPILNQDSNNQSSNGLPSSSSSSAFLGFPNQGLSGTISPGGRPLPTPPPRDGLPLPPGPPSTLFNSKRSLSPGPSQPQHQPNSPTFSNPSKPPQHQPQHQNTLLSNPSSSLPSAPAIASVPQTSNSPSAPPQIDQPESLPDSLDPKDQSEAQKLCKWAASALDYDDLDTARKQLREALDILEGRSQKEKK